MPFVSLTDCKMPKVTLTVDVSDFKEVNGRVTCDQSYEMTTGILWTAYVEKSQDGSALGLFLKAERKTDIDDGSYWTCLANPKYYVQSPSWLSPKKLVVNKQAQIWSSFETTEVGVSDLLNINDPQVISSYASPEGQVHFRVEFAPILVTGKLYTEQQKSMKKLLETKEAADICLLSEFDGEFFMCHRSVLLDQGSSKDLKEAVAFPLNDTPMETNDETCKIIPLQIELPLTSEAIETLLQIIYYGEGIQLYKDFDIARELFDYSLESEMNDLAEQSIQGMSLIVTKQNRTLSENGILDPQILSLQFEFAIHTYLMLNKSQLDQNHLSTISEEKYKQRMQLLKSKAGLLAKLENVLLNILQRDTNQQEWEWKQLEVVNPQMMQNLKKFINRKKCKSWI